MEKNKFRHCYEFIAKISDLETRVQKDASIKTEFNKILMIWLPV
jgi:hypothetical protein